MTDRRRTIHLRRHLSPDVIVFGFGDFTIRPLSSLTGAVLVRCRGASDVQTRMQLWDNLGYMKIEGGPIHIAPVPNAEEVVVVSFSAQPTESDLNGMITNVSDMIASGQNRVVVDLAGVDISPQAGGGGLSALTSILKMTTQSEGALVLCNVHRFLLEFMTLLGCHYYFLFESDRAHALALIRSDKELRLRRTAGLEAAKRDVRQPPNRAGYVSAVRTQHALGPRLGPEIVASSVRQIRLDSEELSHVIATFRRVDKALEALPHEVVLRFASSRSFESYRWVHDYLGLSDEDTPNRRGMTLRSGSLDPDVVRTFMETIVDIDVLLCELPTAAKQEFRSRADAESWDRVRKLFGIG